MRFMGNGITSCYPDEVDNFISITVLKFRFVDDHDLEMACFPFNVADSAGTVGAMMRDLLR